MVEAKSSKMKAVRKTVLRYHKPLTAKDIIRGPGVAKDRFPLLQRSQFGVPPQTFDYDCDRLQMTVDEIADGIRIARRGDFHYRVRTEEIAALKGESTALLRSLIDARGLTNFTVLGDNSLKDAAHQLAQLLYILHAPDVNEVKILRPGRSTKYYERAVYHFLSSLSTRTSLQHVNLNMQCCYKPGLGKYLRCAAARHLVSFRLQTSANVEEYLVGALHNSHMLPNLQQLTLRVIPELTPERHLRTFASAMMRGTPYPSSLNGTVKSQRNLCRPLGSCASLSKNLSDSLAPSNHGQGARQMDSTRHTSTNHYDEHYRTTQDITL